MSLAFRQLAAHWRGGRENFKASAADAELQSLRRGTAVALFHWAEKHCPHDTHTQIEGFLGGSFRHQCSFLLGGLVPVFTLLTNSYDNRRFFGVAVVF